MKKLIIIRGPSGCGKTTISGEVARELSKRIKKLVLVPVDLSFAKMIYNLKENYNRKSSELSQKNTESLVNNFLNYGYTVIAEGLFYKTYNGKNSLEQLIKIGKKNKVKVFVIDLVCDLELVLKRIGLRSKNNPNHDNSKERATKRYSLFMRKKYSNAYSIDLNKKSKEEVIEEILGVIEK